MKPKKVKFLITRIAGIIDIKKTSDLIPLCHNININSIKIELKIKKKTIQSKLLQR